MHTEKKKEYWIEPGKFVERIVGPLLIITVDVVEKEKVGDRTMTKCVKGHWVTDAGIFQTGEFRTDELRPHIPKPPTEDVQSSNH